MKTIKNARQGPKGREQKTYLLDGNKTTEAAPEHNANPAERCQNQQFSSCKQFQRKQGAQRDAISLLLVCPFPIPLTLCLSSPCFSLALSPEKIYLPGIVTIFWKQQFHFCLPRRLENNEKRGKFPFV